MEVLKIIGIGFTAIIISIIIKQYKPEFALYITLLAGTIILLMLIGKIALIIDLISNLSNKAGINSSFIKILLKITGITIITEFAINICKDCGETAIASKIDLGGKVIIVSMSIPIITALLELVLQIIN